MYSIYRPPIDREIVGPVTLSPEWLDIAPNPTLKPSRTVQQIILDLGEPVSVKTQDAMVSLSDGSVVYVEVQLIDDHGNNYYFHPTSNPSPTEVGFHRAGGVLPEDRVYHTMRLRSDRPLRCSRIRWYCFDIK